MPESRAHRAYRRVMNEVVHRSWRRVQALGAIAPGTRRAERFGTFGTGSIIAFPPMSIFGEGSIHIGTGTLIAQGTTLAAGYPGQVDDLPSRALVIGDRCMINVRCGIVAHESIEIGDDVWFGQDVFITDSNHGFDDPDLPIGKQLGDHQPVVVGAGSWLGHGAVLLPGTRLGRNCVVAAGSVVRGEFGDLSVVGGVPAKELREPAERAAAVARTADRTVDVFGNPLPPGLKTASGS